MSIKKLKTDRGFDRIEFFDRYNEGCSIQKSSLATEDCIWFGIDNPEPQILKEKVGWKKFDIPKEVLINSRMHLTKEMVKELLPVLQRFVDTGEINENTKPNESKIWRDKIKRDVKLKIKKH